MKLIGMTAVAALAFAGCSKFANQTANESSSPPAPAVATPHPAPVASARAMRLYPDLAKKDSAFNVAFVEIYRMRKKNDPASLTHEDWPLELAHRTASILGMKVKAEPTPKAAKVAKAEAASRSAAPGAPLGSSSR